MNVLAFETSWAKNKASDISWSICIQLHGLCCSSSMCAGVTVWFGCGGVVSLCRLKHTSNQSSTTYKITQQISRKLLRMDVLTFETCWVLNNEIIKQDTSSWSIFIQLLTAKLIFVRYLLWDKTAHCDQNKHWNLLTKMGPARTGVFTVLMLMIHAFWGVTLRRRVHHYQCFEGSYCLHHQGSRIQEQTWRKSHNDPLKQGELLTQRQSVIPHNTWILNHLNHFSTEGDRGSDNNSHSTLILINIYHHHHHHHKHQGLDPLMHSISSHSCSPQSFFSLPNVLLPCGLQQYDFKGIWFCDIFCKCVSQFRLYSSILSSMPANRSLQRM